MPANGSMLRAVNASLRKAELQEADGATRALAVQYATLIDEAAPKAAYEEALRVLTTVVEASEHPEADKALRRVATALAEHSVASDLGPKLLSTLLALGMAPAARGKRGRGQDGGPVKGPLGKLREEHASSAPAAG